MQVYLQVGVVRAVLLRAQDPAAWHRLAGLVDHWEERARDTAVVEAVARLHGFITSGLKLDCELATVQQAWGVLQTNAMGLGGGRAGRALYPTASLLSHSCQPSLEPAADPGAELKLRAKLAVRAGEQLTLRYCGPLEPRWRARPELQDRYLFRCECGRCCDPGEAASHASSLRCPASPCPGYTALQQGDQLSFSCQECGNTVDWTEKLMGLTEQEAGLDEAGLAEAEQLCTQLETDPAVHPTFYLLAAASLRWAKFLKPAAESEAVLAKAAARLEAAARTVRAVDPGFSKLLGRALLTLADCRQEQIKRRREKAGGAVAGLGRELGELARLRLLAGQMLSQAVVKA